MNDWACFVTGAHWFTWLIRVTCSPDKHYLRTCREYTVKRGVLHTLFMFAYPLCGKWKLCTLWKNNIFKYMWIYQEYFIDFYHKYVRGRLRLYRFVNTYLCSGTIYFQLCLRHKMCSYDPEALKPCMWDHIHCQ